MQKKCTKCGKWKEEGEFSWKNKAKGKRRAQCRDCVRKEDRERYSTDLKRQESIKEAHKNQITYIRRYIQEVKEHSKCVICGESRWYVLDFHHLGNKDFTIAQKVKEGCSLNTIKREIEKCIVVCANCHRELHYQQQQKNK